MVEECKPLKVKYESCLKENLKGQFQSLYHSIVNLSSPKIDISSSENDQCEKLFSVSRIWNDTHTCIIMNADSVNYKDYKSCYEIGMKLAIEKRKTNSWRCCKTSIFSAIWLLEELHLYRTLQINIISTFTKHLN